MSSMSCCSDDEPDDNNMFDQLRSIKAFTVEQLYSLHPDVSCPLKALEATKGNISSATDNSQDISSQVCQDQILYQNLVEYEQLKDNLIKLEFSVRLLLKKTNSSVDKIWTFSDEAERKIGMCQQGKIAETTFKYKKAFIDANQLEILQVNFNELADTIMRDYIYYSFESQMKRHKIATSLSVSYQLENDQERTIKLRCAIITLIDFIKHLGNSKSDFVLQCRRWLRTLIKRSLEDEKTSSYAFVIAQLCRASAGTADWTADLIDCKPFNQVTEFESPPHYITHCTSLLCQLFNSLKPRIRRVTISKEETFESDTNTSSVTDQNWSLIDPRFSCSEEVNNSSSNTLTESDIVKLCLRIPVTQIFRIYVKECLEVDEFNPETDKNYEYIMLKLLTIGTVIIKTFQVGLETFNSIQYGTLIEYLSFQIRQTVIVLSDKWSEFKSRLRRIDNALMLRLQVEYDNFILRSVLIILELRQSGIWRHLCRIEKEDVVDTDITSSWSTESLGPAITKLLQVTGISSLATSSSQTPQVEVPISSHSPQNYQLNSSSSLTYEFSVEWFKEVSEPMLWHILWQFYTNAFVSSCDYRGDQYWLEKFNENSVVYLFVNKLKDSPLSECSYLLNSITSILLSRNKQDSSLVTFIASEIFKLTLKNETLREKISKKGLKSLIRSAEKFPRLISLFIKSMNEVEMPEHVVELMRNCSLIGWTCSDEELTVIETWLIEHALETTHNRCARLIVTKLFLNSLVCKREDSTINNHEHPESEKSYETPDCFLHLRNRRRIALLLHRTLVQHLQDKNDFGSKSLGAYVEVAFGGLFSESSSDLSINLLNLAVDTSYQQLYVWVWRLIFTLKLHILDQPETNWNDIQSRSGNGRSIKNTVLLEDSFHPVPSIQDLECSTLSTEVAKQNPVALFIYLLITDITWRTETLDSCLTYINSMVTSGHLTPTMVSLQFLTICHLNDLTNNIARDQKCLDLFTTLMTSNYDSNRFASFIINQLSRLEPVSQLQLSEFYITVLLEVSTNIMKQQSSSWFSHNEHSLEKIACLLDYIVRFNFTTQRQQIVRKFYNCSYSSFGWKTPSSWFSSLLVSNPMNGNSTRREFLTIMHILIQKFPKFTWLRFVTTECDSIRLERIWEDIVVHLSTNEEATLDSAFKKVCPQLNAAVVRSTLPIYSWLNQIFDIVESDLSHSLCPLVWYNFFLNYFANHLNGVSVGSKLIPTEIHIKLLTRLDSLVNYHAYKNKNWASASNRQQRSLAELYRAYKLWLQDHSLLEAYVEFDRKEDTYLVPLLKSVMSSTEGACLIYMDLDTITRQNLDMRQLWSAATKLQGSQPDKQTIKVDNKNIENTTEISKTMEDEASDAVSLILKNHQLSQDNIKDLSNGEEELKHPIQIVSEQSLPLEESLKIIKMNFNKVFDEVSVFTSTISALDKAKFQLRDQIQALYSNNKREIIRVVPCAEGSECPGPARIKFEVEEATKDDRKSQCIHDKQTECKELVLELLTLPSCKVVSSTITIEDYLKKLMDDRDRAKVVIETLLSWISEASTYRYFDQNYYVTSHLLKATLEILSNGDQVDSFNSTLINACFEHPGSVQIFSPHLSPSSCSTECFLQLYENISSRQEKLGPNALFVLLSKFDISRWLKDLNDKELYHKIIKITCLGLRHMNKNEEESFSLTLDLYRRHIQIELAPPDRRKPEEVALVLKMFLEMMNEQLLYPHLWNDFMSILGFEKHLTNIDLSSKSSKAFESVNRSMTSTPDKSSSSASGDSSYIGSQSTVEYGEVTMSKMIDHISRFGECQTAFDYHALNKFVQIIAVFILEKSEESNLTLVEQYQDYVEQFSIVMVSLTFMWIHSMSANYPDNHNLIWKQFSDLWDDWIYLKKNCQNVSKTSYSLVASHYVRCLRYMIVKINDSAQDILQSVLASLTTYVTTTKEVVYLELTILQRCFKNLPWYNFRPSPNDFYNLATLSEQQNYNVSDLVSHILLHMKVKESLANIRTNGETDCLPHVVERLATTIVLQSAHLKGFRLHGSFFTLIPIDQIKRISSLILPRMEFANLEHSQNNKLLVNLLRFMCIKLDINDPHSKEFHMSDEFDRSLIYAKFVSSYIVDLLKNHPTVLKYHKSYLNAIIDNSLHDLKILASPDVNIGKKKIIYMNLLECCNSSALDETARLAIASCLIKSSFFQDRPVIMMEIFNALGQVLSDGRVLVYTIEKMIQLYFSMNGHYEKVWKSFHLTAIPSDLYLGACVEENAIIALLVYFEALTRSGQDNQQIADNASSIEPLINNNKIWSSFFHWLSQLSVSNHTGNNGSEVSLKLSYSKLVVGWMRLLDMLEPNLFHFIHQNRHNNVIENSTKDTSTIEQENEPNTLNESLLDQSRVSQPGLMLGHKCLVDFIKYLISVHDTFNGGGLWSYLRPTRNEEASNVSIIALGVACFLSDRTLICLTNTASSVNQGQISNPTTAELKDREYAVVNNTRQNMNNLPAHLNTFRDEITKLRKMTLSKLESARKSKYYMESAQYIEGLIESVVRNDKVQYSEGLQLMTTFISSIYSSSKPNDCVFIKKVLLTLHDHCS